MKKIGIITIVDYSNYGNRLQTFAVQTVFKKLGEESILIRYKKKPFDEPLLIKIKIIVKFLLSLKSNLSKNSLKFSRISNFKNHAKLHYQETSKYLNTLNIPEKFHEDFSFLSVGSDQIWGWFNYDIANLVFLQFAPIEKRLTFSPSFGSSTIDEKYHSIFAKGLSGFNNISVRETSGAELVKNFTGKNAEVLCDPTMCLSKEEWMKFSAISKKKPKAKYILTYFLGEPGENAKNIFKNRSKEFEIVNLNDLKSPKYYSITPSEWVDYIKDASLFLTDSFHGVVFSLILQTPFVVYRRIGGEDMQTRITNILQKFKMGNRFEMTQNDESLFKVDFTETENMINSEKAKVMDFLRKSLNTNI